LYHKLECERTGKTREGRGKKPLNRQVDDLEKKEKEVIWANQSTPTGEGKEQGKS